MAEVQSQKDALTAKLATAEELLAETPSAELAEKVSAMLPPPSLTGKHYIQIDIAIYGTITAELDADAAPITVTNFINLVNEGFYNGLTFHRIISGFMIQGGDPKGNGTGGSGTNIKGEFSSNGWDNPIAHERGVLSMARSNAPDSASSQFFIMHEAASHLDGSYAAFGHVLSGMEVVDAICQSTPVTDSNGTVAAANQPVITAITMIEKPAE
ncbi:MAG: peptidylprolyl isomerase [Clostridia bacterium]|nr:peptidylprolyl isomerase [Clostridia bacterium]